MEVPILVISPLRFEPLEERAPVGKSDFMSLKDCRYSPPRMHDGITPSRALTSEKML